MRGIIIDGVAGSGKTTIIKSLNQRIFEKEPLASRIFLSEHYTQRILENPDGQIKPTKDRINNHIENIISSLEMFQAMLIGSKFADDPGQADLFVVLERFVLTHLTSLPESYGLNEATQHLQKLSSLNFIQIALITPEEMMTERVLSTFKYRNDKWKDYLYSIGNEEEIVKYYLDWQRKFLSYVDLCKNSISTFVIEIKNNNFDSYAQKIMNLR